VPLNDRQAIVEGLRALEREDLNLDVKALAGHPGWYRLRVGHWRVPYYSDPPGIVIERIVNRRDLERAVDTL
jgi:mRNA-degrading endonuclease RelE of RelBE toxin-antitoxin system